ncbi:MAG: hypothetical protein R2729_01730 [Bryobacteraceae bacterium]
MTNPLAAVAWNAEALLLARPGAAIPNRATPSVHTAFEEELAEALDAVSQSARLRTPLAAERRLLAHIASRPAALRKTLPAFSAQDLLH